MTYDCPQLSRRSREKVTKMYDASGKRSWYFHFQGLDYYESASTVQSDDYHLSRNRDNYLPTCSSSFSLSTFPAPPLFLFHLYRNHSVTNVPTFFSPILLPTPNYQINEYTNTIQSSWTYFAFQRITANRLYLDFLLNRIQLQIMARLNRINLFDKRSFDHNIKNSDRQLMIK